MTLPNLQRVHIKNGEKNESQTIPEPNLKKCLGIVCVSGGKKRTFPENSAYVLNE